MRPTARIRVRALRLLPLLLTGALLGGCAADATFTQAPATSAEETAPAPPAPYGREASAYTARALPIGAHVWLEADVEPRDRHGRMLAYVWLERPSASTDAEIRAKMLNARLLLDGFAQLSTFPPNVRYVDSLTRYQAEAREGARGLWGTDGGQSRAPSGGGVSGSASDDVIVYITRTGERYHADGCRHLARSKIPVTLGEAKSRGFTPCQTCQPPR